jgi:gluconolactonase
VYGPIEILATGLGHPEGPDILPDGRIVLVDTYSSRINAWSPERGIHLYADCGGGPNACLLGSDGALYITQSGGTVGLWRSDPMVEPAIQRAWPDGRVEVVATEVDGIRLQAPNDLTWGADGRLYFTDPSDFLPDDPRPARIFVLEPDGTGRLLLEVPDAYANGIACEADGTLVWVESYARQVFRMKPGEPPVLIHQLPEGHIPDGMKVDEHGDFWITTVASGGVDIVGHDGSAIGFLETGGAPLNCVFKDEDLIVTDYGDVVGVPADGPMVGRLKRIAVGVRGMPLFRGAIA